MVLQVVKQTVNIGVGFEAEGYMASDGDDRRFFISMDSACELVGFERNCLQRLMDFKPLSYYELRESGFTWEIFVLLDNQLNLVKAIALDDFICLLSYAYRRGSQKATELAFSMSKTGLTSFIGQHFAQ